MHPGRHAEGDDGSDVVLLERSCPVMHNIKCDESSATAESDAMKKVPYEEVIRKEKSGELGLHTDCFVLSGSKVLEVVS